MKKMELIKRELEDDINWAKKRIAKLEERINDVKDFMAGNDMPRNVRVTLNESIRAMEKEIKETIEKDLPYNVKELEEFNAGTMSQDILDIHFKSGVLSQCKTIVSCELDSRCFTLEEARQILKEFGGELNNEKENPKVR